MLKQFATALLVLSTTATALAQKPQQDMRFRDIERPRTQFSQFLMRGFSVGLEYAALDGSAKLTGKDLVNGVTNTTTAETSASVGVLGVSVNYGHLPRNDFGLLFGMNINKKLEDNKNSTGSLSSSGSMLQYRPDVNAAFSFANGLYGAVGVNLSVIDMKDNEFVSNVGFGIQAQVGFIPLRNLGIDVGYYISRHNFKEMWLSSDGKKVYEIDSNNSYVDYKQLRARLSYLF